MTMKEFLQNYKIKTYVNCCERYIVFTFNNQTYTRRLYTDLKRGYWFRFDNEKYYVKKENLYR